MNHQIIHNRALEVAAGFKRSEIDLIEILEEVWKSKTFYFYKCRSLFDYAGTKLKLSDDVASVYTRVMKKGLTIPGFKEQIRSGQISISNANRICSVLTNENKEHWFKLAQGSKRQLEREIALASPKSAIRESIKLRAIGDVVRAEIRFGTSESYLEELKRARDLLSQQLGRGATLEDLYKTTTGFFLDKKDPLRKNCPGRVSRTPASTKRARRVTLNRQVHHKDQSQCTHIDETGQRCQERRHLHIHHIKPLAQGGTNHIDNLTILCSGHHKAHHNANLR